MFGRHPNLLIDVAMGISHSKSKVPHPYGSSLKSRVLKAYDLACKSSDSAKLHHKLLKDVRCHAAILEIGDKVLVRQLAFQGKHKLADAWEPDLYVVVEKPNPDIPVYVVEPDVKKGGRRRTRTLHRNHLLHVGDILCLDVKSDSVVGTAESQGEDIASTVDSSDHEDSEIEEVTDVDVAAEQRPNETVEAESSVSDEDQPNQHDASSEDEEEAPERRYPQRDRRPPDRYEAVMSLSARKLQIVQDMMNFLK